MGELYSLVDSLKGKRILVTGSSGFLGSHVCQNLLDRGCEVVGIDNFSFSSPSPSPSSSSSSTHLPNKDTDSDDIPEKENTNKKKIIFRRVDITDANQIGSLFKDYQFDLVFHLAAVANPRTCKENFDLAFNVNVAGTKNILVHSTKCDLVVFMSSAAVYGEPLWLPIDENHPTNGADPYSITKIMGENLCFNFVKNYGQKIIIARNFNTFGIGQLTDYIVPTLIRQALTNKKIEIWNSNPVRDMTYVDNTVNALLAIVTSGARTSDVVYNIGSGRGIRIGELASMVRDNVDKSIDIVDLQKPVLGSPRLVSNNTKLRDLGWQEKITLEVGLSKTIEWSKAVTL
jgi:nucleoside-diphosphate-sugar epimerase